MVVWSVGLEGMRGYKVAVEADVRTEKEQCIIVGLPDASIKESKEQLLSNLYLLEHDISMKRMTLHLSPSDKRKTGVGYDCAMLLAVLEKLTAETLFLDDQTCFLAGLSLNGRLTTFHGLVPSIQQAIVLGFKRIFLPPIDLSLCMISTSCFVI